MIGEHTLYRKIQAVLDVAQRGNTSSIDELIDRVASANLINFLYIRFNRETEEEIPVQSASSIKNTVKICSDLALINKKGELSSIGQKAANPADFAKILGKRIIGFLESQEVTVQDIEKQIISMLRASPPVLPTSKALWEALHPSINRETFLLMFTLLAQCEHIIASRRKIYLGFQK